MTALLRAVAVPSLGEIVVVAERVVANDGIVFKIGAAGRTGTNHVTVAVEAEVVAVVADRAVSNCCVMFDRGITAGALLLPVPEKLPTTLLSLHISVTAARKTVAVAAGRGIAEHGVIFNLGRYRIGSCQRPLPLPLSRKSPRMLFFFISALALKL